MHKTSQARIAANRQEALDRQAKRHRMANITNKIEEQGQDQEGEAKLDEHDEKVDHVEEETYLTPADEEQEEARSAEEHENWEL